MAPFRSLYSYLLIALFFSTGITALAPIEIFMPDVGEGSGAVVSSLGKPTLIVDAGSKQHPRQGKDKTIKDMIAYIKSKTPDKHVAIIVSHPDVDHGNWISPIARALLKDNFHLTTLLGGSPKDYQERERDLGPAIEALEKQCKKKGYVFTYCSEIKNISDFAKEYLPSYCSILAANSKAAESNDKSIVVRVFDQNFSILLPGDATQNVTDPLPKDKVQSSVLVASHHGAYTHGCNKLSFLRKVNADMLLISNGMRKGYRHIPEETIANYCTYFNKYNPYRWYLHTINFFTRRKKISTCKMKNCDPIIKCAGGWVTALTVLPIFSTVNMGNMKIEGDDNSYSITSPYRNNASITRKQAALSALSERYLDSSSFNGITEFNFPNLNFTDDDIRKNFKKLPQTLERCNLSGNKLTAASVTHFIPLLEQHPTEAKIKFGDNIPYKKEEIDPQDQLQTVTKPDKKGTVKEVLLKNLMRVKNGRKYTTEKHIVNVKVKNQPAKNSATPLLKK